MEKWTRYIVYFPFFLVPFPFGDTLIPFLLVEIVNFFVAKIPKTTSFPLSPVNITQLYTIRKAVLFQTRTR